MTLQLSKYDLALLGLVAAVFVAHMLIIATPFTNYIFDEKLFVPPARCILNLTTCTSTPPLPIIAVASSIAVIGDHGIAWRLPSVLAGTFALVFVYLIVRRSHNERTAFIASFLLGIESLWFTHASMALRDTLGVLFGLAGIYALVREAHLSAGILFGIAFLSKETMVIFLPIAAAYTLLTQPRLRSRKALRAIGNCIMKVIVPALLVFTAGLWAHDLVLNGFETPWEHVQNIASYHAAVSNTKAVYNDGFGEFRTAVTTTELRDPQPHPLRWFTLFEPRLYYIKTVEHRGEPAKVVAHYQGMPNMIILWLVWLAFPLALVQAWKKKPLDILMSLWFVIGYIAFILLAEIRITYPYYMLFFMPALCIMNACLLERLPRLAQHAYLLAALALFVYWFPVIV
jgi:4-amino-4-deoxy-L-arabinose transferase-like glycosyltransferase